MSNPILLMKLIKEMKYLILMLLSSCMGFKKIKEKPVTTESKKMEGSFYDFKMNSLYGEEEIDFSIYKGKKVLLVNTASKCGFTPQYKTLQELNEKHGGKVVILGFPANNFGKQEPGSNKDIGEFCEKNYGVSFQMFDKISVKGEDMHPLYQWLSQKNKNGWNDEEPNWNFCKYLVNENGELEKFFASSIDPMGEEILTAIGVK